MVTVTRVSTLIAHASLIRVLYKEQSIHHSVAWQCVRCCKGDAASQWEWQFWGVRTM